MGAGYGKGFGIDLRQYTDSQNLPEPGCRKAQAHCRQPVGSAECSETVIT